MVRKKKGPRKPGKRKDAGRRQLTRAKPGKAIAKAVEQTLDSLERGLPLGDAVVKAALELASSPRKIWSLLHRKRAYQLWLSQQTAETLEATDLWSDKVAEIIISSLTDEEIDHRILQLSGLDLSEIPSPEANRELSEARED